MEWTDELISFNIPPIDMYWSFQEVRWALTTWVSLSLGNEGVFLRWDTHAGDCKSICSVVEGVNKTNSSSSPYLAEYMQLL